MNGSRNPAASPTTSQPRPPCARRGSRAGSPPRCRRSPRPPATPPRCRAAMAPTEAAPPWSPPPRRSRAVVARPCRPARSRCSPGPPGPARSRSTPRRRARPSGRPSAGRRPSRDVPRQPDAIAERRRPNHARGRPDDRARAVRPHDHPRFEHLTVGRHQRWRPAHLRESTLRAASPRRTFAPAPVASARSAGSSAARSNPTAVWPPRLGAVREPERAAARRLDAHRRDRPRDAGEGRLVEPCPAQLAHGRRRREHATRPPAPGRCTLEEHHLATRTGEIRRGHRARGAAADDHDVDAPPR